MGFCLLNNVAVAAAAARARGARVAIVDIDVHHGNGTEEIFAADPDVLFISLHQYPFYPGTGAAAFTGTGLGQGATVNIPLPQGCDDRIYRRCFARVVLPVLSRFAPDLILVSAGYDAHRRDPLAGMALTEEGFGDMFARLLEVQPRLAAVLEGGYHLEALGLSVAASMAVLLDGSAQVPTQEGQAGARGLDALGAEVEATLGLLRRLHHVG
jgi:acetoin utilization deacetylase AcuC-like enzyme